MEVSTADPKGMNVARKHSEQKPQTIDHKVHPKAAEDSDRKWRKEDVDYSQCDAIGDVSHGVATARFSRSRDADAAD